MPTALAWAALLAVSNGLDVSWTAPVGCPEQAGVTRDIEVLVGRPLTELTDGTVTGRIEQAPHGYRLKLELTGPQGQELREVEAADCQMLGRAAALMVAVAVDAVATGQAVTLLLEDEPEPTPPVEPAAPRPLRRVEPTEPEGPSGPEAEVVALGPAPTPVPLEPPRRDLHEHHLGLGVSAGAGWGLTPAGTGGVEAEVGWLWRGVRVSVAAHHWFSRTESLEPGVAVAAAVSGAAARGCYAPSVSPMEFPLCAVVDLGALHGGGRGERVVDRRDAGFYVGVGAGVGANWVPRPRFALRARFDVIVAARRPGFHLNRGGQQEEAYRMPAISVRLVLGPQLRLLGH